MALVTTTTSAAGNREDLIPLVTMISPHDTPFLSSIATKKATGTKHEWLTDALGTPALNAVVEGAAANPSTGVLTPRVRNFNTIQNIRKVGYQLEKSTKNIALDTERAFIQGAEGTTVAGAPTMLGLFGFTQTNQIASQATAVVTGVATTATNAAAPATTGTITLAAGHGAVVGDYILITQTAAGANSVGQGQYRQITAIATNTATVAAWDVLPIGATYKIFKSGAGANVLTSVKLNDAFEACYLQGGNPDCVFAHPTQKRAISNLAATVRRLTSDQKKLGNSVDIYESDFGAHSVKTNRWMPTGSIAVVEKQHFAAAYLRPVRAEQLARVGSSRDFMIESAVTLEARAENASALILGLA